MPKSRAIARDAARRPVATLEHRRFPLGWTAPEVSALTGVPTRTLQVWRKEGFFVPALPAEASHHAVGELYDLGDAITVRVMRMLLAAGVDRDVVARLGEELPTWAGDGFFSFRDFAAFASPWWCMIPAVQDLLESDEELVRWWPDDRLAEEVSRGVSTRDVCGLVWLSPEPLAVWFPVSAVAAEIAGRADQWRRQRRIPAVRWPPWM